MTTESHLLRRCGTAAGAAVLVPLMLLGVETAGAFARGGRPVPGEVARTAVGVALQQLGKPYRWGAKGPASFDASGLVTFSYGRAGQSLPHGSFHQFRSLPAVESRADVLPGDLVFANDGACGRVSSVSIVVADGEVVRASSAAGHVVRSELRWQSVVGIARPSPATAVLKSAYRDDKEPPGTVRPTGCPPADGVTGGPELAATAGLLSQGADDEVPEDGNGNLP
ncbi:MAG: NlpC/P60 family protein [Acidimicrobiales bacterium]